MAKFLHDWGEKNWQGVSGLEAMKYDFSITDKELEGVEILLASYTYEDYSGNAFVLFKRDEEYFEVNGSHCSCYGLEDQWEPEKVSVKEMYHRLTKGTFGRGEFAEELYHIVKELPETRILGILNDKEIKDE